MRAMQSLLSSRMSLDEAKRLKVEAEEEALVVAKSALISNRLSFGALQQAGARCRQAHACKHARMQARRRSTAPAVRHSPPHNPAMCARQACMPSTAGAWGTRSSGGRTSSG